MRFQEICKSVRKIHTSYFRFFFFFFQLEIKKNIKSLQNLYLLYHKKKNKHVYANNINYVGFLHNRFLKLEWKHLSSNISVMCNNSVLSKIKESFISMWFIRSRWNFNLIINESSTLISMQSQWKICENTVISGK